MLYPFPKDSTKSQNPAITLAECLMKNGTTLLSPPPPEPVFLRNPTIFTKEVSAVQGITGPLLQERIPSWNSSGRPKKVRPGTFGFNFQTRHLEYWNGKRWQKLAMKKI
jgi:hypothetical protein